MILDTNAYTALQAGHRELASLVRSTATIIIPLPVIAELRYGFLFGARSAANEQKLQRFLAQDGVEIAMPTLETADDYGELALFCRRAGRALSHNDLWIAALARRREEQLVTFDKDFEVFAPMYDGRLVILDA